MKGWSAVETIGLGITSPRPVGRVEIDDEMWASICEKAAAEGMEPLAWFDREIERANAGEKDA